VAATHEPLSNGDRVQQLGQEVVAKPVYRGAIVVGGLALAAFTLVAILVASGVSLGVDLAILSALHQLASPTVVSAAALLTMLGNEAVLGLLPLSLIVLWVRRLRWQVVEVAIAMLGAQVANDLLKLAFHRERPAGFAVLSSVPGQTYSFPSGHAMVSIAFYGALAYVGWRVLRGWQRTVWIAAMVAIVGVVGLTRLVLAAHYPTDVLASWAFGLVWLDLTLVAVGYVHWNRSERASAASQAPAAAP
jgi:undecaprenyl-diphosphatase